jgi:heme exporter protein A
VTELRLENVTIERGERMLFAPLSLSASGGTLVRIAGANGAGKTTLLRALAGLMAVASGKIHWLNDESAYLTGHHRVFVGHSNAFNDSLTPLENCAFSEGVAGTSVTRDAVKSALAQMGVASLMDRRVGSLSQGQKKRVALSRLFLPSNANVAWLLDEPFVALDVATQALLASHIEAALTRGALVVLTSHQAVNIAAPNVLDINLDAESGDAR